MTHRTIHSAAFDQNLLTFQVPVLTNINFLLTISQGQQRRGGFSPPKSQAKNKNLKINKNIQWRRYFQRGRQFVIKVQQRHGCNHPCCSIKYISSAHFGVPLCCFQDILSKAQDLKTIEQQLIDNVIVVCKLVHINPATSATGEKFFSTARWIKMELRSRMLQARFNHLTILNTCKHTLDTLCLVSVANSFVSLNENRERIFGKFTTADFSHWTCCFPLMLLYMHCSRKLTSASQIVLFP